MDAPLFTVSDQQEFIERLQPPDLRNVLIDDYLENNPLVADALKNTVQITFANTIDLDLLVCLNALEHVTFDGGRFSIEHLEFFRTIVEKPSVTKISLLHITNYELCEVVASKVVSVEAFDVHRMPWYPNLKSMSCRDISVTNFPRGFESLSAREVTMETLRALTNTKELALKVANAEKWDACANLPLEHLHIGVTEGFFPTKSLPSTLVTLSLNTSVRNVDHLLSFVPDSVQELNLSDISVMDFTRFYNLDTLKVTRCNMVFSRFRVPESVHELDLFSNSVAAETGQFIPFFERLKNIPNLSVTVYDYNATEEEKRFTSAFRINKPPHFKREIITDFKDRHKGNFKALLAAKPLHRLHGAHAWDGDNHVKTKVRQYLIGQ